MSETGTILDYLRVSDTDDFYADRRAEMADWSRARLEARLVELGVPTKNLHGLPEDRARVVDIVISLELAVRPVAKEGRAADVPLGISYQAPWEQPGDGFNEHARRAARALSMAGCPVHLRGVRPFIGDIDPGIEKGYADLTRASIARYSVTVHQVVPTSGLLTRLTSLTPSAARVCGQKELAVMNALRVLYTVWERGPAPPEDVKALSSVGQAWVACQDNADMLAASGVPRERLRVVPIPHFPDDPHLRLQGRARRPGPARFLHIGKWEPRKAQDKIVLAFMRAFRPGEAELYLKTSQFSPKVAGYPTSPTHAVRDSMQDREVIVNGWKWPETKSHEEFGRELGAQGLKIYQAMLPADRLVALHGHADVYVSLSRGEGFDLPAYDSKLAGNLMVFAPSGGPQDFAEEIDTRVEPTGRIPCHPLYGWGPDATYLDYSVEAATEALRRAAKRALERRGAGAPDLSRFSAHVVGRQMLGYLEEVLGGKAY